METCHGPISASPIISARIVGGGLERWGGIGGGHWGLPGLGMTSLAARTRLACFNAFPCLPLERPDSRPKPRQHSTPMSISRLDSARSALLSCLCPPRKFRISAGHWLAGQGGQDEDSGAWNVRIAANSVVFLFGTSLAARSPPPPVPSLCQPRRVWPRGSQTAADRDIG